MQELRYPVRLGKNLALPTGKKKKGDYFLVTYDNVTVFQVVQLRTPGTEDMFAAMSLGETLFENNSERPLLVFVDLSSTEFALPDFGIIQTMSKLVQFSKKTKAHYVAINSSFLQKAAIAFAKSFSTFFYKYTFTVSFLPSKKEAFELARNLNKSI